MNRKIIYVKNEITWEALIKQIHCKSYLEKHHMPNPIDLQHLELIAEDLHFFIVSDSFSAEKNLSNLIKNLGNDKKNIAEEKIRDKRMPIISIMGHVNHGKTSLVDKLMKNKNRRNWRYYSEHMFL